MRALSFLRAAALPAIFMAPPAAAQPARDAVTGKQRMIILSDIEADPDDTQSFVRLFL